MENESLGSTVENFASRIRRKLKEQETQQTITTRAAGERQALLLKAMTSIRKALQEAAKISLGERFRFELDISDWEGWPKLELKLIDMLAPDLDQQALIATAHDRNELGTIQLQMRSGEVLARVLLKDPEEYARLPLVVKKSLRQYLDIVAHVVLNPTKPEDTLEAQSAPIEEKVEQVEGDSLSGENVFVDDYNDGSENRVAIEESSMSPFISLPYGVKA